MTYDEAKKLIFIVLAALPHMQDRAMDLKPTAQMWSILMADIPGDVAAKAVAKVLMTAKFFPTVAEIREAAAGMMRTKDSTLPLPEEAWEEVLKKLDPYKVPQWSSPEIDRVVKMIGYRDLCEGHNMDLKRAHFLRLYGEYRRRMADRETNQTVQALTQDVVAKLMPGAAGQTGEVQAYGYDRAICAGGNRR